MQNADLLRVKGIQCGVLDAIISLPKPKAAWAEGNEYRLLLVDVGTSILELQKLLHWTKISAYSSEDETNVIWTTLVANSSHGFDFPPGVEFAEYFRAVLHTLSITDETWPPRQPMGDELANLGILHQRAYLFVSASAPLCRSRRRGRTKSGLVGQFPRTARVDDVVFIPCGSAISFIIRPVLGHEHIYRWIGECYVHGIMEGQAFRDPSLVEEIRVV